MLVSKIFVPRLVGILLRHVRKYPHHRLVIITFVMSTISLKGRNIYLMKNWNVIMTPYKIVDLSEILYRLPEKYVNCQKLS